MSEPKEVPFTETGLGSQGGVASRLHWHLQAGEVGMWASKPLNPHKTIHIAGVSTLDVAIEGSNFPDGKHPVPLHEHKTYDLVAGDGMFVLHENPQFFRPVCREGADVDVIAIVTT